MIQIKNLGIILCDSLLIGDGSYKTQKVKSDLPKMRNLYFHVKFAHDTKKKTLML